jgi:hypothetical protein
MTSCFFELTLLLPFRRNSRREDRESGKYNSRPHPGRHMIFSSLRLAACSPGGELPAPLRLPIGPEVSVISEKLRVIRYARLLLSCPCKSRSLRGRIHTSPWPLRLTKLPFYSSRRDLPLDSLWISQSVANLIGPCLDIRSSFVFGCAALSKFQESKRPGSGTHRNAHVITTLAASCAASPASPTLIGPAWPTLDLTLSRSRTKDPSCPGCLIPWGCSLKAALPSRTATP